MDQPLLMSESLLDLEAFLDVGNARAFRQLNEHFDNCTNNFGGQDPDAFDDEEDYTF